MKRSLLCLVGALAFAWCFELFLTVAMVDVPAHGVGAPLVLGTTSWSFLGGGTRDPHAGELFLGNVVITGIFLWLVTVWWAWRGLLVGSLGVVLGPFPRPMAPHQIRVGWIHRPDHGHVAAVRSRSGRPLLVCRG